MFNVLTVDVEEYFHPTEIQAAARNRNWTAFPSRVENQMRRILDLFDEHNVSATFFVLGWIAEHHPHVVRMICQRGRHEIACHSYAHQLVYELSPRQFRADTGRAMKCIEDASGITPRAYRAPSYSITARCMWAFDILAEMGFTHDSSVYPIAHDRYGIPGFNRNPSILRTASGPLLEVPAATVLVNRIVAPIGGGAYLRVLPYAYISAGIRRVNNVERKPVCMYFHPWEMDPEQPRIAEGFVSKLRTYTGLHQMNSKIQRLLSDFQFTSMDTVYPVNLGAASTERTYATGTLVAAASTGAA